MVVVDYILEIMVMVLTETVLLRDLLIHEDNHLFLVIMALQAIMGS